MTTFYLATRRPPEDCVERLARVADGTCPVPALSLARAREEDRLLGRVTRGQFVGAFIDGVPMPGSGMARVLAGILGFRMGVLSVRVKVGREPHGSLVRVSFHTPIGDAAMIGLVLGISLAVLQGDPLQITAALPIALAVYLFLPILRKGAVERAQTQVVDRVSRALDANPI